MFEPTEDMKKLAIEELRRTYDKLDTAYDTARVKSLTFLGGGLAVMSFLYAGGDLFIPHENYGKIFYFTGIALVVTSLGTLFHALGSVVWKLPGEFRRLDRLDFRSETDFINYVKEEYIDCNTKNLDKYQRKQSYLNTASLQLVIGAIILLVLKNFGG